MSDFWSLSRSEARKRGGEFPILWPGQKAGGSGVLTIADLYRMTAIEALALPYGGFTLWLLYRDPHPKPWRKLPGGMWVDAQNNRVTLDDAMERIAELEAKATA